MIPTPDFHGLFLFTITSKDFPGKDYEILAKNTGQAWSKFVARHYRNSPLAPDPKDWNIATNVLD